MPLSGLRPHMPRAVRTLWLVGVIMTCVRCADVISSAARAPLDRTAEAELFCKLKGGSTQVPRLRTVPGASPTRHRRVVTAPGGDDLGKTSRPSSQTELPLYMTANIPSSGVITVCIRRYCPAGSATRNGGIADDRDTLTPGRF
jgi:hypothetical protein